MKPRANHERLHPTNIKTTIVEFAVSSPITSLQTKIINSQKHMTNKKKEPTIIYQDNFTDIDFVEYVLLALEDIEVITPEEYNIARTQGADLYPGLISLFDISPKTFYRHFVEQDDDGCWFAECLHVHLNMNQPEYFLRDGVVKSDFREAVLRTRNGLDTKNPESDGTKSYRHLFEE